MSESQNKDKKKNVYFLISEDDFEFANDSGISTTGKTIVYQGREMEIGAIVDRVAKKQKT